MAMMYNQSSLPFHGKMPSQKTVPTFTSTRISVIGEISIDPSGIEGDGESGIEGGKQA
jgi:hypothetical protein